MQYPQTRLRRKRSEKWLRDMLQENYIRSSDLILPLFVCEGEGQKQAIDCLPDIYRYSIDVLLDKVGEAVEVGIKAIALFPQVPKAKKTILAEESYNENNLICRAIISIKKRFDDKVGIIADVALDPYNSLGHDGLVKNGEVLNDETVKILVKQSLCLARAGADIVAPSDMMDGRIGAIRNALEEGGFSNVKILSYAVKFSSSLYTPFRNAVGSDAALKDLSKDTYQMSCANNIDVLNEVKMDIDEGADFIMVKPATLYLDIVKEIKNNFDVAVFSYMVSGEYAMMKAAGEKGYIDYKKILFESLIACKRAGSTAIFCYDAIMVAQEFDKR